ERGCDHAHHGECHGDEGLLERAGAAHPRDDVARDGAVAQLVADAVHHAAHQQAVETQADRPQQQRAAIQPPGQPVYAPQPRANRALADSCAVTAATAVKSRPEQASAAPNASDPPGGTWVVSNPAAPIAPVTTDAPNDSSRAALRLA